jgi:8-oxo-dGTP pyrophosphatase MutT (NUDIX family)
MQLVFSDQAIPQQVTKSLFLAGPSPRKKDQQDWRHDAIELLTELGYDGTVFLPVPGVVFHKTGLESFDYDTQVSWEVAARKMADCIVFWVPRVIDRTRDDLGMPGFTTNFELGDDLHSGKVVYGRPDSAPKCTYLDHQAVSRKVDVNSTLLDTLKQALAFVGEGAFRQGGEVGVPLFIWNTLQFQSWYTSLKCAGNELRSADILHFFRARKDTVFSYVMAAHVWVRDEDRIKSNEILFSRPDISVIVAHGYLDGVHQVALIKEFRAPVNNAEGFVYELPGGSSPKEGQVPEAVAQEELREETGLHIANVSRFRFVGQRQLVATFSTHLANVFAVALTTDEMRQLKQQRDSGEPLGVTEDDSEQTYVQLACVDELVAWRVDYSTMGAIAEALGLFKA